MTKKKIIVKKPTAPAKKAKNVGSATLAAILGKAAPKQQPKQSVMWAPNGKVKIKPEWQGYYHTLLDLRERLQSQMSGLAKESATEMESYSLHMGDSGTDNFDRDFALSLLSSDQDAIYEIEEALKRIERGTFGVCELSNKNIPKARLEAIPWTRFTVEAQAQLEREGALRQKRLAALGSMESTAVADIDESDVEEIDEKPAKEKE
ncbi:MAG: transcriptional regulator [Verrucomicrobia bacterium]|nr:transcriptional regulator [Verrucomicrobiota bacterium]NBU10301.1 transcriptional regulator [Pseudomonadota bacterium]NDA66943.1 transcriptional regulator [Verrucomicrobiota bacterium]NDB75870.1 transcriptional regulator [Verrucomicrobiota bacterium]NDD38363.1 transcriptional regulator [Verrucomicrobiota bacterium]